MGFGAVNRKLMTIRLCLSKVRLNNLLLLQINVTILTALDSNYESKLVDKTVDLYLKKNRNVITQQKAIQVLQNLFKSFCCVHGFMVVYHGSVAYLSFIFTKFIKSCILDAFCVNVIQSCILNTLCVNLCKQSKERSSQLMQRRHRFYNQHLFMIDLLQKVSSFNKTYKMFLFFV